MKHTNHTLYEVVSAHCNECKKYVEGELYGKALLAVKDAKYADPRNIYLIALEKQIKLLSDLSKARQTATSHKNQVRDSIFAIIRRATEDARSRGTENQGVDATENGNAYTADPYTRERELALKRLKNQFIKIAEQLIDRADYQGALEEIRRIFIIDPNNATAKDLETKIENLLKYQNKGEAPSVQKKKKRRFLFHKTTTAVIAFLVVGNILIFYLTSTAPFVEEYHADLSTETYTPTGSYPNHEDEAEKGDGKFLEVPLPTNPPPVVGMQYDDDVSVGLRTFGNYTDEEVIKDQHVSPSRDEDTLDLQVRDRGVENTDRANVLTIVDGPAEIKHLSEPVYPAEAIENGIEGDVVVRVLIDSAGTVLETFVEISDHPLLNKSALESARLSRFWPTERSTESESSWVSIPYRFRIIR